VAGEGLALWIHSPSHFGQEPWQQILLTLQLRIGKRRIGVLQYRTWKLSADVSRTLIWTSEAHTLRQTCFQFLKQRATAAPVPNAAPFANRKKATWDKFHMLLTWQHWCVAVTVRTELSWERRTHTQVHSTTVCTAGGETDLTDAHLCILYKLPSTSLS
jgi:hypothetical protein